MLKKQVATAFLICFFSVIIPAIMGVFFLYGEDYEDYEEKPSFYPVVADAEIYIEGEDEALSPEEEIDFDSIDYTPNELEQYIVGVVAAEMPPAFRFEALKAQAVASRTYAVKRLDGNYKNINSSKIGQAYISVNEMKKRWGGGFDKNYERVRAAVYSTRGIIIEYNGEAIEAVFHSTSSGVTETAENVWGRNLPYIKSVESEGDKKAPNYETSVSFEKNVFEKKIKNGITAAKKQDNIFDNFKITKRSDAGYVLKVSIGSVEASGRQIREILGLRSADFDIKRENGTIIFTTKGYGHGAGMSQYGAEFMAEEGKSFEEILKHYYSDVEIAQIAL